MYQQSKPIPNQQIRESTNVKEPVDQEEDALLKMLMEKKLISELD